MLETELIGKTVNCILCRGSILYFNEAEKDKFSRHLQFEHSVMYDFDFMLAACKMTHTEKTALVSVFNKKAQEETPSSSKDKSVKEASSVRSHKDVTKHISFKNQIRAKFRQKLGRNGRQTSFGNNILDVKVLKAKQFDCKKCTMKFKSLPKLVKHKQKVHAESVTVKSGTKSAVKEAVKKQREVVSELLKKKNKREPSAEAVYNPPAPTEAAATKEDTPKPPPSSSEPTQSTASSEPPKNHEVTGPATAGLEGEAVKTVVMFPPKLIPEIKIENDDAVEIGVVVSADKSQKEDFFSGMGLKTNTDSATNSAKMSKQKIPLDNSSQSAKEKEATANEKESDSVTPETASKAPPEEAKTPENPALKLFPDCATCAELENSSSKLNRHQRYVHGEVFKTDSPKILTKRKKESLREAAAREKKEDAAKEAIPTEDLNTTPASEKEKGPMPPSDDTPLRSCLKRSSSLPRRLSVSFKDMVNVASISEDKEQAEVSPKRGRGRPRKIVKLSDTSKENVPEVQSKRPAEEEIIKEPSKKARFEHENEGALRPKPCFEIPEIKIEEIVSVERKMHDQNKPEPPPAEVIKPSSSVPNLFILRQCENCPEMFSSPEQLQSHSCVTLMDDIQPVSTQEVIEVTKTPEQSKVPTQEVIEVPQTPAKESSKTQPPPKPSQVSEKKSIETDILIGDDETSKESGGSKTVLEEEVVTVEASEPAPRIVAPRFVLDNQQVMVLNNQNLSNMVKLPYDSFLETVLAEDSKSRKVQETQKELVEENLNLNAAPETIEVVCDVENTVDLSPLETLHYKYQRQPAMVDFTKSNFFMKNAELIGGKGTGSGFREVVPFLPEGWRVKTFNEYKKFYFTPENIVLKSCTAVIEYLRLKYDLAQEDLKILAEFLSINSKIFNRYLDELFDDCVVLE